MEMSRFRFPVRHTGFHHLLADQHNISLLPLAIINRLVTAVFKAVQATNLYRTIRPSTQPATLPGNGSVQQLQSGSFTLFFAHQQSNLITLLRVPPVPNTGQNQNYYQ